MNVLRKFNLELLTVVMFGMVALSIVFIPNLSVIQKIMLEYMFVFTLHEWEENRIPGGFAKLMARFFGLEITKEQEELSHIPVAILLIVILFVPFFWQNGIVVLIPVFLGIFEVIVHVVGIKLHKMDKPYTPGLVTAILLLALSIYARYLFSDLGVTSGSDYFFGVLLMFACFAVMQRMVLAIFGLGYKDMIAKVKMKLSKSKKCEDPVAGLDVKDNMDLRGRENEDKTD